MHDIWWCFWLTSTLYYKELRIIMLSYKIIQSDECCLYVESLLWFPPHTSPSPPYLPLCVDLFDFLLLIFTYSIVYLKIILNISKKISPFIFICCFLNFLFLLHEFKLFFFFFLYVLLDYFKYMFIKLNPVIVNYLLTWEKLNWNQNITISNFLVTCIQLAPLQKFTTPESSLNPRFTVAKFTVYK